MSILHADNFSIYGSNANKAFMLNGIYATITGCNLVVDPDAVSPGFVLQPGWDGLDNTNDNWRYPFQSGEQDTAGIALRLWQSTLPGGNGGLAHIADIRSATNGTMAALYVESTGTMSVAVIKKSDGTILTAYTTDVPVVTATGWYHIEFKYEHPDPNVCSFELRVEGRTVLTQDAVPDGGWTSAGVSDKVAQIASLWRQIAGPSQYFIKDLVIWDGEGTDNNDFLGSVLVTTLAPTADVDLNWTPSAGATGYTILDNIPPVDATYLAAPASAAVPPTFPDPYVASMSDLPVSATSVKAVLTFVRAAKSDGGDGSMQVGLISDPLGAPVTVLGADRPITIAQTYWRDVFEQDPKTNAPWAPGAVNAANLQINRTT